MDFNIKKPTHIFAMLVLLFALFLLIISPILSFVGVLPTTQSIELSEWIIILSSVIAILVFIGTPFLWYLLVNKFTIREMLSNLRIKKEGWDTAVLWAVIAVIIMFAIIFVVAIIISQIGLADEDMTNIQDLAGNLSIVSLVIIIIFQSASEEIFFRGFLLDKINSLAGKEVAIFSTAALFGIAHLSYGQIYTGIMTGVLGLILAYIVMKTKNLISAIVAHAVYNLISFALYFLAQSL